MFKIVHASNLQMWNILNVIKKGGMGRANFKEWIKANFW